MAVAVLAEGSYVANAQAPACAGLIGGLTESDGGVTSITATLTRSYLAGDTLRTEFTPSGGGPHTATITDVTLGAVVATTTFPSLSSAVLNYKIPASGDRTIRIDLTAATPNSLTFRTFCTRTGVDESRADTARLMTGFILRQVIPQNTQTISDLINDRLTGTGGPQFSAVPGRTSFRASSADLERLPRMSAKPPEPRNASGRTQLAAAAVQPSPAAAELRRKLGAIDRAILALDNLPPEARSQATARSRDELVRRRAAIAAELARSGEPTTAPAAPLPPTPGGPAEATRRLPEAGATPLNVWAAGAVIGLDNRQDSTVFNATITTVLGGADYLFGPNLLVGLAGGYERYRFDTTFNSGSFKGEGLTLGPYAGLRLADRIVLDVWAGATFLRYRMTDEAGGDNFSARRWFASGNLTGTWQWGPWRVAPRASIFYVEEEQTDIEGLTAGQIVRLGRVSLGPEIGYTIPLESERLRIELFGFAKSEYDFATDDNVPLASGPFRHQRWGGRVGGGANIAWHPNFTARIQGSYNGLGQNGFDSWSGELRIGLRF
jgi:hypothetical protein